MEVRSVAPLLAVSLAVLIFLGAIAGVSGQDSQPDTVSICRVLVDPAAFRGQLIRVRGKYVSTDHGPYLAGDECVGTISAKGYAWPKLISLNNDESSYLNRGLRFEALIAANSKVRARYQQALEDSEAVGELNLTITLQGWLEAFSDYESQVALNSDSGKVVANGFGHLNAAPAQLFIIDAGDLVFSTE